MLHFFFLEQEIDFEALIDLQEKDLIPLLPKTGPRVKLWKKLETYKLLTLNEVSTILNARNSCLFCSLENIGNIFSLLSYSFKNKKNLVKTSLYFIIPF